MTHHEQKPAVQNAFSNDVLNTITSYEELGNPFLEEGENLMAIHTRDIMHYPQCKKDWKGTIQFVY